MIALATPAAYLTDLAVLFGAVLIFTGLCIAMRRHEDRQLDRARGRGQGFKVWNGPNTRESAALQRDANPKRSTERAER